MGMRLGEIEVQGGDELLMDVRPEFWGMGPVLAANFEGVRKGSSRGGGLHEREFMLAMEVQVGGDVLPYVDVSVEL